MVPVAIALCHVLNGMVLKEVLGRPRPFLAGTGYLPLVSASGYSMPSGHASRSFAAATVMMLYSRKAGAISVFLIAERICPAGGSSLGGQ